VARQRTQRMAGPEVMWPDRRIRALVGGTASQSIAALQQAALATRPEGLGILELRVFDFQRSSGLRLRVFPFIPRCSTNWTADSKRRR